MSAPAMGVSAASGAAAGRPATSGSVASGPTASGPAAGASGTRGAGAGAIGSGGWRLASFPIDLGWRNLVFAARTVIAAIAALAISYWLDLQDPQWSALTVFLVTQPTAGAAAAKSAFRVVGTVVGAVFGLVALALFAEAMILFIATMVAWLGLSIYGSMRVRNFVSYGFLLAGYSALLVGYEGLADPTAAWSIAADRTAEIVLGIACSTAASLIIAPVYAGDVLRGSLGATFSGLAAYAASALRPETSLEAFAGRRRRMIADVVKFDALRSYTVFEAPEMRPDDEALRRVGRDFLGVLAVARSLYVRLGEFRRSGDAEVLGDVDAVLSQVVEGLERIAGDRAALAEPRRVRHALFTLRRALAEAAGRLEALAGTAPTDTLANGLLVIRRAGDMTRELAMVMVADAATFHARARPPHHRPSRYLPALDHPDAVMQGVRAGLALLIASVFWVATAWSAGFSAIIGLVVMLFIFVNQDDPGRVGWPYMFVVTAAVVAAYLTMDLVLPHLEGFEALALVLAIILFPAALAMGTPRFLVLGSGFGAFFMAEIGTGNVFQPPSADYVNNGFAIVAGMAICLAVAVALLPVDPLAARRRAWAAAIRALPAAARGERPERAVAAEVFATLAGLLPRLDLDRSTDEDILRGALGAASVGLELGRLRRLMSEPALPEPARRAVGEGLDALADVFSRLTAERADRPALVSEGKGAVAAAHAALLALPLEAGSAPARMVARAVVSLRFIADRFESDRPFLIRSFAAG